MGEFTNTFMGMSRVGDPPAWRYRHQLKLHCGIYIGNGQMIHLQQLGQTCIGPVQG